jgi:mannosyltransferase OCH1-like enzyme
MIPKILHRMWLDQNIMNNEVAPKKYDKFIKSFTNHNPDFIIMFWNMEKVIKLFDNVDIFKYKKVWEKLDHHMKKCDFARYIIMYLYGGIYVDLDFMCFRNLTPLLNRELLLVFEPPESAEIHQQEKCLCNGFIGSIPKHLFWLQWMDFIEKSINNSPLAHVMLTTGPVNFNIFFSQSKYKNTETVNTCDIMPLYVDNGINYVTRDCIYRNNGSKIIKSDDYYKHFQNYTHTKWSEGSGWGSEKLTKKDYNYNHNHDNNTEFFVIDKKSHTKKILTIFVIIIILIIVFFILIMSFINKLYH